MSIADDFTTAESRAAPFKGMMGDPSIALFQCLLSYQREAEVTGDMMEFGAFCGRSASVIMGNLNPGETIHLVDVPDFYGENIYGDRFCRLKGA